MFNFTVHSIPQARIDYADAPVRRATQPLRTFEQVANFAEEYAVCEMGFDHVRVSGIKADPEFDGVFLVLFADVRADSDRYDNFVVLVQNGEVTEDSLPESAFILAVGNYLQPRVAR